MKNPIIDHNNLEDYQDPVLYDLENVDFEPDGPFYLALAERYGSPILDLGCGTGRVTIPLAQRGHQITGLDIVPEMLELARRKAGDLPIQWVEADLRTFQLDQRYQLICSTGRVFLHLLGEPDQEAALARIREHLAPGGIFQVDAYYLHPERMKINKKEQDWYVYMDEEGREVRVSGTDDYDPDKQIKYETAIRRWVDESGKEITQRARLALRYYYPRQMEDLLQRNGFVIRERYGDWEFGPLREESRIMIYICQKGKNTK